MVDVCTEGEVFVCSKCLSQIGGPWDGVVAYCLFDQIRETFADGMLGI